MKYNEVKIEDARKCCKEHNKKCEICPLRRTREHMTKYGIKEFTMFCWFILMGIFTEDHEEMIWLQNETVHHEEEYKEWLREQENKAK